MEILKMQRAAEVFRTLGMLNLIPAVLFCQINVKVFYILQVSATELQWPCRHRSFQLISRIALRHLSGFRGIWEKLHQNKTLRAHFKIQRSLAFHQITEMVISNFGKSLG